MVTFSVTHLLPYSVLSLLIEGKAYDEWLHQESVVKGREVDD